MINPELIELNELEQELLKGIEAQMKPLMDTRMGIFMGFLASRGKKGGGLDYKDGKLYWIPPNEEVSKKDKETK